MLFLPWRMKKRRRLTAVMINTRLSKLAILIWSNLKSRRRAIYRCAACGSRGCRCTDECCDRSGCGSSGAEQAGTNTSHIRSQRSHVPILVSSWDQAAKLLAKPQNCSYWVDGVRVDDQITSTHRPTKRARSWLMRCHTEYMRLLYRLPLRSVVDAGCHDCWPSRSPYIADGHQIVSKV